MPRPHPLRRLIDGRPGDPGRRIARRTTLLMIPAVVGANLTGAIVVFSLITWVLPLPDVHDRGTLLLVNLLAAAAYVAVACVVGTVWGLARWRETRDWLVHDREPDEDERRTALRVPLRHLHVSMTLWGIAVAGVFALNAPFSFLLAVVVAVTTLLGAVTTGAMTYLLAERIMRAASARALAHGMPESPVLPGVTTRALLAWALGSGVPLVGLIAVAIVALAGADLSERELALSALVLGGVALLVGAIITWQAARAVADPVGSVRDALGRVEAGDLDARVPVFDGSDLGLLQAGFNRMNDGLREREELRDLFGRHVGEDVARAAAERGIELGGEELEVAVLFVDLVGSTSIAAERPPEEVVALLNEFFGVVVEVVEDHGGWINKFEGDAALAVFGAPLPLEDAAGCALAAGRRLAERIEDGLDGLEAGIGISAGRAVAGNVGAESRFEYTVIGDPVNEAARLCELAKEADGYVLASASALDRAGGEEAGRWREDEAVTLRGRSADTRLAVPA
ncbi:MAG TPA: adenylate/guanylate cyclase domain-containing protein [Solirubrobacteraceae bacterium]|nr:adenylate/guanylate cyclase domain-containing protein [Solirubrobacteraceae bacterium]